VTKENRWTVRPKRQAGYINNNSKLSLCTELLISSESFELDTLASGDREKGK
jgi:hypothetical protein